MRNEYDILISKLDSFIKKFYKIQFIKGVIISLFIFLILFFIVSFFEYIFHFSKLFRKYIFISVQLIVIVSLIYYVVSPLAKLFKIGKRLSHRDASEIISLHFADMKDKLINILELSSLAQEGRYSSALIFASIDNKAQDLKPYQFSLAVDLSQLKSFAKFLGLVFLVYSLAYFVFPSLYSEGSKYILDYHAEYIPKAPFEFCIVNNKLSTTRGSDFEIQCLTKGQVLPDKVYIQYGGNQFLMNKKNKKSFSYQFNSLVNDVDFHFVSGEYRSPSYKLVVMPLPTLLAYQVQVCPPSYTGEKTQLLKGISDLSVPMGSVITWDFETSDVDSIFLQSSVPPYWRSLGSKTRTISFSVLKSDQIFVGLKNKSVGLPKYLAVSINCIPDLYPEISLNQLMDSANVANLNYAVNISDDYGFTALKLKYRLKSDSAAAYKALPIQINTNVNKQLVSFSIDFAALGITPGQSFDYCFEVTDNDQVNKPKSTQSSSFVYRMPSVSDIHEEKDKQNQRISNAISSSLNTTQNLKDEINKLQQSTLDNSMSEWQRNKMLNELNLKESNIEKLLNQVKQELHDRISKDQSVAKSNPELLEKQKQLENLLKDLINDDLRKIMDQIEKMKSQMDSKQIGQQAKDLKYSLKEFEKQLENNLQLLKRMDVEQKLTNAAESVKDLSIRQENLADELKKKNADSKDAFNNLEEQRQDFKKAQDEYQKAQEQNEQLKQKMNIADLKEEFNKVEKSLEKQSEQAKSGNKKDGSREAGKNSKEMKQLASKMEQMNAQMQEQQNSENMDDLRQILTNIVRFSFAQEEQMKALEKALNPTDPSYVRLSSRQKNLREDFQIVNDSLNALMKRTPQVSMMIKKDLSEANRNLDRITEEMESRNIYSTHSKMQYVMTSSNKLALLLSEALNQMQNAQSSSSSSGKPQKGKKGKQPQMSDMKGLQQGLKQQLEQMLQQMQNGQGAKGEQLSKQMAEALAKEEIFNQMLNELKNSSGLGQQAARILDEINKMVEESKREIINRKISPLTLNRQDNIIKKLLQAERAEKEKEQDDKRESKESNIQGKSKALTPIKSDEKANKQAVELNRNDIKLNVYYQNKYKSFLGKLKHN